MRTHPAKDCYNVSFVKKDTTVVYYVLLVLVSFFMEQTLEHFAVKIYYLIERIKGSCTAIPYRVSTGPEQGFPCVLFPNREKPVFITGIAANENRFFPVGKSTQGNPCFHYRDGFAVYDLHVNGWSPMAIQLVLAPRARTH